MKQSRPQVNRPFIVGRKDDKGRLRVSSKPYCHPTIDEAVVEAQRLHVQNDGAYFVVFGVVGSSDNTPGRLTRGQKNRIARYEAKRDRVTMADVLDSLVLNTDAA